MSGSRFSILGSGITLVALGLFSLTTAAFVPGCEEDSGLENAAEETQETMEDAAEETEEALDEAADETGEAVDDMTN